MLKKSLIFIVFAFVLGKVLTFTPYFEARSDLICSRSLGSNEPGCLKIKNWDGNDKIVTNLFNLWYEDKVFEFEVDGTVSKAKFSFNGKKATKSISGNSLARRFRESCNLVFYTENLKKVSISNTHKCEDHIFPNAEDVFVSATSVEQFFVVCRFLDRGKPQNGYHKFCRLRGQYKSWKWEISFPKDELLRVEKVISSAQRRFDSSFLVLDDCPIAIPFI